MNKFTYSPGPTNVRQNVMLARATEFTNPDFDINFYDTYKNICENLKKIFKTSNDILIMSGEGIIGLEAACACLTEKDDRVLVISNGIFGEGFKDFVSMFGGNPVLFESSFYEPFNLDALEKFLKSDSNFKYATIVHCDTPTGMLNPLKEICNMLHDFNIPSVVDMVSSLGGSKVDVDEYKIDIALCASQKCFSTPPGLTFLSISENAINIIKNRKTPVPSYYMNLLNYLDYYEKKWFPYTMPISDILGLEQSVNNILEEGIENVIIRHENISRKVINSLKNNNISLLVDEICSSPTVTAIKLENNIKSGEILDYIYKTHNILLSSSIGQFKDTVIRIGHMGENANDIKIMPVLYALENAFSLFYKREINLIKYFA